MAAAVIVTSPAGPPTPECPIWLQANEAIVAYTQQFIDWQAAPADAAGAARVSIDTFQAIKAFAPRCMISRNGPDMLAAHGVNVLEIRFTDAFWSRLLTELKASNVFANRISDVGSLHDAIQGATILNPANLEVTAADWRPAEPYAPGPPHWPSLSGYPSKINSDRRVEQIRRGIQSLRRCENLLQFPALDLVACAE